MNERSFLKIFFISLNVEYICAMFVNAHTHIPSDNSNAVTILNLYKNFEKAAYTPFVSLGVHPWYISLENVEKQLADFKLMATSRNVVAIGECGLDRLMKTDWNLQLMIFESQVALAEDLQKPLIIHCVKAFPECLQVLKGVTVPVIFHGVNHKYATVEPVLKAGYYLSFGNALSAKNPTARQTFIETPMEQLFLETDDSVIAIEMIYKEAAIQKEMSEKSVILQLYTNYQKVFL